MKALKLIVLFVIIVGGLLLVFNWHSLFGSTSQNGDAVELEDTKRCPYCGEEILAVAKKCKHCNEWMKEEDGHMDDNIQQPAKESSDALIEYRNAKEADESLSQEEIAGQANEDAERKAQAEADRRRQEAEKKVNAQEERADLIRFVSTHPPLEEYRKHPGYLTLSQKEKIAIEAFLNPQQYYSQLTGVGRKKLHSLIEQSYSFQTMDDIYSVSGAD